MNIEMLETIIPLLTSAGEGTFWLVLIMLGQGYLSTIAVVGGWLGGIWFILRTIRLMYKDRGDLVKILNAAGETLYGGDYVTPHEMSRVLALIEYGREHR